MNAYDILRYPLLSEKSMNRVDANNELVFVVTMEANKKVIQEAVEKTYQVKVLRVNTQIDRKGKKRAFVKLAPEFKAVDIMTK
ncbi:TPA: 50S ribosomal protein L23, partial [archaeon]|nr:50S ribosomal protein L23 [Candidatus Naiadarchaeales archaeon SRR2090159.bin1288]